MLDATDQPFYLVRHSLMRMDDVGSGTLQPGSGLGKIQKMTGVEAEGMWENCAVDLRVSLPRGVAEEVEEAQRRDPEMMSRIVMYAFTRRTIFDHLAARTAWPTKRREP